SRGWQYCQPPSSGLTARWAAWVAPPAMVVRLSAMRWIPRPSCAFFAVMVRELTPIQEISDDRRPYSILGQRSIHTFRPAASALAAASVVRKARCNQITLGRGWNGNGSLTMGTG